MKLCFLDIETTGNATTDEVIQLGAIVTDMNLSIKYLVNEYCMTNTPIHPEAYKVHGIDRETLIEKSGEIYLEQIINTKFPHWRTDDMIFIAYGSYFDLPMINNTLRSANAEPINFGKKIHQIETFRTEGRYNLCARRLFETALNGGTSARLGYMLEQKSGKSMSEIKEFYSSLLVKAGMPVSDGAYHDALFDAYAIWLITAVNKKAVFY